MKLLLYAMAGGALGSGTRHLLNIGIGRLTGAAGFPWWTFAINVTGCFFMGALIELLALRFNGSQDLRTFLATGILGGYTTFSAFSLDFVTLMNRHDYVGAGAYVIGSVVLSLIGVYAGLWLVRTLLA